MVDHGAQVFALDRDPDAIAEGHALVAAKGGALTLIEGRFSEMEHLLKECGVTSVSGVTLDIGVSSMQLDRADRGFRSEEHTSELQSLMRISYAVFCLKKKR